MRVNVSLAFVFLLLAAPAVAWGPAGHRLVGAVADELLSVEARAAVAEYLRNDLDRYNEVSGRTTLASVSMWADEIRGLPADRPTWHFDDIPVCGPVAALETWCPDGACATQKTAQLAEVLRDQSRSMRERNEALKWIVHLVGDLHQPLHAADNADRGGNDVRVALEGRQTRGKATLHSVWDNELLGSALAIVPNGGAPPAIVRKMVSVARSLPASSLSTNPDDWARESNDYARTLAYGFQEFACGQAPASIVLLSLEYQHRAEAIIRERLLLAGARLAALLNQIFRGLKS